MGGGGRRYSLAFLAHGSELPWKWESPELAAEIKRQMAVDGHAHQPGMDRQGSSSRVTRPGFCEEFPKLHKPGYLCFRTFSSDFAFELLLAGCAITADGDGKSCNVNDACVTKHCKEQVTESARACS